MTAGFYFGDSDDSDADTNDANYTDANLPFPKPLSRASFVSPNFDPATFLSSLTNRHQTLSDLQTELRELSQSLNNELLDLVNENYQDFLSLGSALTGGEEKVEQVRVGLLAFQRDVKGIRDGFEKRIDDISALLEEKKGLRKEVMLAYDLLDIEESIGELEDRLMIVDERDKRKGEIGADGRVDGEGDDDEELHGIIESETEESDGGDDGDGGNASGNGSGSGRVPMVSLSRLGRHIHRYLYIKAMCGRIGEKHPFIVQQDNRMERIRMALILDLKTGVLQAKRCEKSREQKLQAAMRLYELIGEKTDDLDAETAMKKLEI
ncbi:conserved hypothetical protein [Histoplasma capsulatum G186AR]|uniref:Conserved oligomeric Golgi complex subunit 2 n=2 Tax=Ajellomyces capsulatus TaxID=5037 RepID=C0NTP1_AJECG|nr:uncharacterized protein HCBG_06521 [Histoplasma capsulatum G186AR]EEH05402.1 conserved hypothetical protein [Histoplasma capsulatum G186AR]KAG5305230.1 Cog2 superfamily domain-containing protein [Histoplasma capsulatum]QSS76191.1 Cog2 superfamily domain-containing protein [Histoplasma capsulatum G186AR]